MIEVRSEVSGTLSRWLVGDNASVSSGTPIAAMDPSLEVQWEGLRALFLTGETSDLPVVEGLARGRMDLPDYIRQQAQLTARAIRERHPQ